MRPIKFRVWEPRHKVMVSPTVLQIFQGKADKVWADGYKFSSDSEPDMVLMQFTGLLDCHGKEIYEGDILLNHFRDQKLIVVWDEEIIGSRGGGWNYKKLAKDPNLTWKIEEENIEVIGNIYEHEDYDPPTS